MPVSSDGRADLLTAGLKESLDRVSTLAATALSTPNASVIFTGAHALPGMSGVLDADDEEGLFAQLLCADVIGSEDKLIIGDIRLDRRMSNTNVPGPAGMIAWAGVPVHDQGGQVAGVLWVADQVPRQWSATDVAVLETLAEVASSEVTLRAADRGGHGGRHPGRWVHHGPGEIAADMGEVVSDEGLSDRMLRSAATENHVP